MLAIMMELVFEVLREAGLRLPRMIGPAVSIVGGLVGRSGYKSRPGISGDGYGGGSDCDRFICHTGIQYRHYSKVVAISLILLAAS